MIVGTPHHTLTRVAALEERLDAAEKSLRILAEDWRKQRALNGATLKWIVDSANNNRVPVEEHENLRNVINALSDAIKP